MSKRKSKPKVWPPVPVSGQPFDGGERPFGTGRLFDNHTHLPLLPGDYVSDSSGVRLSAEEQMERAVQSGVQRVVVSLCSLPEVQVLSDDRERFSGSAFEIVRFAVAIHPNDAPRHLGILDTAPDNVVQTREPWQETPLEDALAAVERAARDFPEKPAWIIFALPKRVRKRKSKHLRRISSWRRLWICPCKFMTVTLIGIA